MCRFKPKHDLDFGDGVLNNIGFGILEMGFCPKRVLGFGDEIYICQKNKVIFIS